MRKIVIGGLAAIGAFFVLLCLLVIALLAVPTGPTGDSESAKQPKTEKPKTEQPKAEPQEEEQEQESAGEKLYEQAVIAQATKVPAYEVDGKQMGSAPGRVDLFIIADPGLSHAELGAIMLDAHKKYGSPDLLFVLFLENPDVAFETGQYAATSKGYSFMTGEDQGGNFGEYPAMQIEK